MPRLAFALVAFAAAPTAAQPYLPDLDSEQWYSTADDGHRTYVYEVGRAEAAGDTVLVLHGGWGAEHGYLLDALLPLADGHRLVLYDQRASLRSPAPDSTVTLDRLVADLDALRADAGLDRATLLTHSMGAHLAFAYLAAHPDRVRGLVLVGPVLPTRFAQTGPGPDFLADVWPEADVEAVEQTYLDGIVDGYLRGFRQLVAEGLAPARYAEITAEQLLANAPEANVEAYTETLPARERTRAWRVLFSAVNTCDASSWRQMQGGQVYYSSGVAPALFSDPAFEAQVAAFWPALQAFRGPVRVVLGTCDYVDPGPTVWPRVVGRLDDGQVAVVDGAGHAPWMDRPEGFTAAARAALAATTE